jgi:NAD+ kinase
MRAAAIISKPSKPELYKLVPQVAEWLRSHGYEAVFDLESSGYAGLPGIPRETIAEKRPCFVIVLGGDGTLLSAARAVAHADIPILAVNLGSLGFLTEVPLSELYTTLEATDRNECPMESRSMVHCELMRQGEIVAAYDALNDVVVNKSAIARLVSLDLFIDGLFVANYKADGVIISTPTGSTAYSLAAGGPILAPSVDGFVIAPVCPHSLSHRPVVVRDTTEIELVGRSLESEAFLSIDGQVGVPVVDGDRVICRKSQHKVKLLRMRKTFFEVLRTKLKWAQR